VSGATANRKSNGEILIFHETLFLAFRSLIASRAFLEGVLQRLRACGVVSPNGTFL
jgi:hypothetical protein